MSKTRLRRLAEPVSLDGNAVEPELKVGVYT